jgi:EAL domain-containing protein (putative c-di-GMP-specific phosphodiesterase class I)
MDNAQFYQQASVRPKSAYLELETELRRALDQGELRLFYQPEVRSNGSLDSFEVLLVWENPRRGRTSAAHFISIAEDSGMIIPIGEWVLNEACRQCAAWRKLYPHARLAVNVSALQFTHHRFLEMVEGALERAGLPGSALELELTESCILSDVTESARRMQRLRSMGVQLSIDDFGTGYSSLSYLRKLPVNGLKIDKSFLREVGSSPSSVSMVNTIVSLAKSMGLFVVGEGVETYEQLDLLRSAGCDRLQGHLFGAPMPADAAAQFLAMPAPVSPVFSAQ